MPADLFSFGLVLPEMATGQRGFSGNTATVIRDAVLNLPVVPARQVNADLPPWLERVIQKSLEKDPDRRYQTAAQLRANLIKFGAETPRVSWRPPRITAGLAALLLVTACLLLVTNIGGLREKCIGMQPHRTWPHNSSPDPPSPC